MKKTLEGVLNCVLNREERDPAILSFQQELRDVRKAVADDNFNYGLLATTLQNIRDIFYIEIVEHPLKNPDQPSAAVFRQFCGPLADYISVKYQRNIDHTIYRQDLLEGICGNFSEFKNLDQRIPRNGSTWTMNLPNDKKKIEVRPLRNLDELYQFVNPKSDFCFFDPDQNVAQLYLYAAHQHTRLLGIWKVETNGERKPQGIVPLLMMKCQSNDRHLDGIPFLYVEAPMIHKDLSQKRVKLPNGETPTFNDVLIDIIAVYTGLQCAQPHYEPFPLIGTGRKDDAKYSGTVHRFVEAATSRFSSYKLLNQVTTKEIATVQKGPRKITDVEHDGTIYMQLPEDVALLKYLQDRGYRFNSVLMNTHAFLEDKERKKTILYDEWGVMRGNTKIVPIPDFFPVYEELIHGREEKLTKVMTI